MGLENGSRGRSLSERLGTEKGAVPHSCSLNVALEQHVLPEANERLEENK